MRVQDEKVVHRVNNLYPRPFKVNTNGSTLKTVEPRIFLEEKKNEIKR